MDLTEDKVVQASACIAVPLHGLQLTEDGQLISTGDFRRKPSPRSVRWPSSCFKKYNNAPTKNFRWLGVPTETTMHTNTPNTHPPMPRSEPFRHKYQLRARLLVFFDSV